MGRLEGVKKCTNLTNRSSAFRRYAPPPDPKRLRLFAPLNSNVMCKWLNSIFLAIVSCVANAGESLSEAQLASLPARLSLQEFERTLSRDCQFTDVGIVFCELENEHSAALYLKDSAEGDILICLIEVQALGSDSSEVSRVIWPPKYQKLVGDSENLKLALQDSCEYQDEN